MKMSIRRFEGVAVLALLMASLLLSGCPPSRQKMEIPGDTVYEYEPASDTWTEKATIPRPRLGPVRIVCNGRIYLIGGYIYNYDSFYKILVPWVDVYDPSLDEWSTAADVIDSSYYDFAPVYCTAGDKIYVMGGTDQRQTIREYDTTADTWTRKTDFPSTLASICVVLGNEIFVFTANDSSIMWKYDIGTDTWFACADPPNARMPGLIVFNSRIYMIGGTTTAEYDPSTDTWTRKSNMPTGHNDPAIVEVAGKLYVLGGWTDYGTATAVDEYDPVSDQWITRSKSIVTPTYAPSTFVINDKIYQLSVTGEIAEYDTVTNTWTRKSNCPTTLRSYSPSRYVETGGKIYVVGGFFWDKKTRK